MSDQEIPNTLDECFLALDKLLGDEMKQFMQDSSEDEFVGTSHHTLGRWLRNSWGLWGKSSLKEFFEKEAKLFHADDMSGMILTSYWRKKHDQPLKIKEQIKHYHEFWERQEDYDSVGRG